MLLDQEFKVTKKLTNKLMLTHVIALCKNNHTNITKTFITCVSCKHNCHMFFHSSSLITALQTRAASVPFKIASHTSRRLEEEDKAGPSACNVSTWPWRDLETMEKETLCITFWLSTIFCVISLLPSSTATEDGWQSDLERFRLLRPEQPQNSLFVLGGDFRGRIEPSNKLSRFLIFLIGDVWELLLKVGIN